MGTQLPQRKGAHPPPLFGPCLLWPNGRPSQQLLSSIKIFGNLFLRIITLLLRWLFCIYICWSCCRILTMLLCIATNICRRLERDKGPRTLEVTVGRCVNITVLTEHLLTEVPSFGWVHPSINGASVNFRNWQSMNPLYMGTCLYKWWNFRCYVFRLFTARSWQVAAGTFSVILQLPYGQRGRNGASLVPKARIADHRGLISQSSLVFIHWIRDFWKFSRLLVTHWYFRIVSNTRLNIVRAS